jgi:hypothetical protein
MDEIVASVARVTDIMAEIASASQEQSESIKGINNAMAEMDEMTQQNAALVEQAAAAAESMQDQAAHLADEVGAFRLSGAKMRAPTATAKPAARLPAARTAPARPQARALPKAKANPAPQKVLSSEAPGKDDWEEF